VDSPFDFGSIAAANALSDVYAMGGQPITALNIVCFPVDDLPESILEETLAGGLEKLNEAGTTLAGGHSIDDTEFKYGLSVTGIVHPKKILTNAGAEDGDRLILTKPIGTGILATAIKGKLADNKTTNLLIDVASQLNKYAADIILNFTPSAITDITGFGLAGHICEMAAASLKKIRIYSEEVPFIEGVLELARMGLFPAGAYNNKNFFESSVTINPDIDPILADLMFDPQTSGGLLVSLPNKHAADCLNVLRDKGLSSSLIGEVIDANSCGEVLIQ